MWAKTAHFKSETLSSRYFFSVLSELRQKNQKIKHNADIKKWYSIVHSKSEDSLRA